MLRNFEQIAHMRTRPFEQIASLKIKDADGNEVLASAVVYQDPHFLHANRIALLGSREHEIALLRLSRGGVVDWELHGQTISQPDGATRRTQRRSGTGWVRTSGMAWGVGIAEDSIQPYADIQILDARDQWLDEHAREHRAEYAFLQRPRDWHVPRRSYRTPSGSRIAGSWKPVKAMGLRYRLLQVAHERDDERIGQEYERIELPGIEISPLGEFSDLPSFFDAAERLWLLLRPLLVFRFRQFVYPLSETRTGPGLLETRWHAVRLEPREREQTHADPPFLGSLELYLSKSVAKMLTMEHNRDLLHAAAIGYATSFKAAVIEGGLTSAIEGIERLVEAFEQSQDLSREAVASKRWKKLGAEARRATRPFAKTDNERDALNRALSDPPNLRLIERIERMVKALPHKWRQVPDELLKGGGEMIKARNAIVHGRMVADLGALRIHILRAQTLFERMWVGFLNCGDLKDAGWAAYQVRTFDSEHLQNPK